MRRLIRRTNTEVGKTWCGGVTLCWWTPEAELTEHLGHEHGQTPIAANMRNGTRSKTVLTEIGPVEIEVPRDRDGSFEPVIVPKRKRRLDGIDQIVLSLSARGLTTGEIAAHFEVVYGAKVSKDTISRITEKVVGELAEWSARPSMRSIRCSSLTRS
jgi:putative transposase